MKDIMSDVEAFHLKYQHHTASFPSFPSVEHYMLRRRLIKEESKELIEAIDTCNMVEIADGMADLTYVIAGAALCLGIPLEAVWHEVQSSNMTKSLDKKNLKTVKGPDFRPPDIERILRHYGWNGPVRFDAK